MRFCRIYTLLLSIINKEKIVILKYVLILQLAELTVFGLLTKTLFWLFNKGFQVFIENKQKIGTMYCCPGL